MLAMLSGWDCAWTTSLMRVPTCRDLAKWPSLPQAPKAVYLRPFLVMRLLAELLTVPKRVMVCWVCMVFLLLPGRFGTHPKGREGGCSQVAASPRCQEKKFLERDPEPARGEESNTRRARNASYERRAEGRSFYTEAVAE
jgi:hypothetical protein